MPPPRPTRDFSPGLSSAPPPGWGLSPPIPISGGKLRPRKMGRQLSPVAEILIEPAWQLRPTVSSKMNPERGWESLLFVERPVTSSKNVAVMVKL